MITIETIGVDAPPAKLNAVRELTAEYGALPHTAGRWLTIEADVAMLPHPFVMPTGILLLATDAEQPLGCGGLRSFEQGVCEIKRLYVRPAARGRGLGVTLLTALLEHAAGMGFTRVRLDTAPELTAALELYRRFGFIPIPHYRADLLPDALCFERSV